MMEADKTAVLGLGTHASRVAQEFRQWSEYYDVHEYTDDNYASMEEYEKNFSQTSLSHCAEGQRVSILVDTSDPICGATLQILKQVQQMKVRVYCLSPNLSFSSELVALQDKLVCGVLQELARSGVVEQVFLIKRERVERLMVGVGALEYGDVFASVLANTIHMANVYATQTPLVSTTTKPNNYARIATLGVVHAETFAEVPFADLKNISQKDYLFAYSKETLADDSTMSQIKKTCRDEGASYSVYETPYPQDYIYCTVYSTHVQTQKEETC